MIKRSMIQLRYICALVLLLISMGSAKAQYTLFGESGTVYFDKTMYIKNIVRKQFIERSDNTFKTYLESMLPQLPENMVLKKELKFNGSETMFVHPKQEIDQRLKLIIMQLGLDMEATTYSNLKTKDYQRFNDFAGEKFIIKDSIKNIKWKITDEYREIAGYNCRRANGLTQDSVYVVAYYTVEIPVDGGPESIHGLPGMILGMVVPSQHVSYFATKVELTGGTELDKKAFENPKTKRMTRNELKAMLKQNLGNFLNEDMLNYILRLTLL